MVPQTATSQKGFLYAIGDGTKQCCYLGSAKHTRYRKTKGVYVPLATPGPTWRFVEHFVKIKRSVVGSKQKPYTSFRRIDSHLLCCLIVQSFPMSIFRRVETHWIKSVRPEGNSPGNRHKKIKPGFWDKVLNHDSKDKTKSRRKRPGRNARLKSPFPICMDNPPVSMKKTEAFKHAFDNEIQERRNVTDQWASMAYRDLYDLYLGNLATRLGGPSAVDLCSMGCSRLLMTWLTLKGKHVPWKRIRKSYGKWYLEYDLLASVHRLKGVYRQNMAKRNIMSPLKWRHLPVPQTIVLTFQTEDEKRAQKKAIFSALSKYPAGIYLALRDSVKFLKVPLQDYRSRLGQIQCAKRAEICEVASMPRSVIKQALNYEDSILLRKSLNTPVVADEAERKVCIVRNVSDALEKLNATDGAKKRGLQCINNWQPEECIYSPEWMKHCEVFECPNGQILEKTDKDNACAFKVKESHYRVRLFASLERLDHWDLKSMSHDKLAKKYEKDWEKFYEEGCIRTKPPKFDSSKLPYLYQTSKAKCITEKGRICRKPQHACSRGICSMPLVPGKKHMTGWARAITALVRAVGWGVGCWRLEANADMIRENFGDLRVRPHMSCGSCQVDLEAPGLAVIDAGQFFERVSLQRFMTALAQLIKTAHKISNFRAIAVPTHGPFTYKLISSNKCFVPQGWVCVDATLLWSGARLITRIREATLGDLVASLQEGEGVLIGSRWGTAMAELCLSYDEVCAARQARLTSKLPSCPPREGYSLDNAVSVRVVDDVIVGCETKCGQCLYQLLQKQYSVPFDLSEHNEGKLGKGVVWTDLSISFDHNGLSVKHKCVAEDPLDEVYKLSRKLIVPKCIEGVPLPYARVRSVFFGSFARIGVKKLSNEQNRLVYFLEFARWLENGYPVNFIKQVLYGAKTSCNAFVRSGAADTIVLIREFELFLFRRYSLCFTVCCAGISISTMDKWGKGKWNNRQGGGKGHNKGGNSWQQNTYHNNTQMDMFKFMQRDMEWAFQDKMESKLEVQKAEALTEFRNVLSDTTASKSEQNEEKTKAMKVLTKAKKKMRMCTSMGAMGMPMMGVMGSMFNPMMNMCESSDDEDTSKSLIETKSKEQDEKLVQLENRIATAIKDLADAVKPAQSAPSRSSSSTSGQLCAHGSFYGEMTRPLLSKGW